jgi:ATP-dependent DNA helicase RecQ
LIDIGNKLDTYKKILAQHWGYASFRPLQEEIILSVAQGNDTLALMPTGGGKSITFQVPALAKPGLCIVVTPLIALMKDQVENLRDRKIKAVAIYSGMTKHEIDITLENCVHDEAVKFLYCSPERLGTELFRTRVKQMNVNLLAIDEAHCISQWGYDFRPSYLEIAKIRPLIPNTPILAVTATATPEVVDDIQEKLLFKQKNVFSKSFERKNLVYLVRQVEDKPRHLLKVIGSIRGTGIIYVRNRLKTKEIAQFLQANGISADFYHAGLAPALRNEKQNHWKSGKTRVIVSTNAFGMGIDKPDVRFVVHIDLPDTLEAYFQEAGRAGRDEKQAFAVLLYHPSDQQKLQQRTETTFPPVEDIRRVYEALGNYYQLAVGSGKGMSYDFDIAQFIKTYRFNLMVAFSSLQLLQQSGYIELSEELHNPSRLIFLVARDDLYRYQVANAAEDSFIKLLLRCYTGLFTEYRPIDETDLAKKANTSREVVYTYLKKLSRDKIVNYIPQSKLPQIYYCEERLDSKSLYFSPDKYNQRKDLYGHKIDAVVQYATHNKCRVQQLLAYFGMPDVPRCGTCDVCTKRNELNMSTYEFDTILEAIKKTLHQQPMETTRLVNQIKMKEDRVVTVLQWLLDNGKVIKDNGELLRWHIK